jgi:hypothetical protein
MRRVTVGFLCALGAALMLSACGGSSPTRHVAHRSPLQQASHFAIDYIDHARNNCCATGLHAYDVYGSISKIDPRWAKFTLQARFKNGQDVGGILMILYRKPGGWTTYAMGGGPIACGVPKAVRAELQLVALPHCKH